MASVVLTIAIATIAISSIVFLSNNLFKAFVPKDIGESNLKFDLDGYRDVLKDLNRTPSVIIAE